jgi:hypothetical protein
MYMSILANASEHCGVATKYDVALTAGGAHAMALMARLAASWFQQCGKNS